jgi:parallel beta-helix repeat protein
MEEYGALAARKLPERAGFSRPVRFLLSHFCMKFTSTLFLAASVIGCLSVVEPAARAQTSGTPLSISSCGRVVQDVRLAKDLATTANSCLTVAASGVTIDGAGHRITAALYAVQWIDQSNVTVKNVVSDRTLQIYGAKASHNLVTDSTFNLIAIYGGDDNVVQNSTMKKLKIYPIGTNPAQREVVSNNVISGTLSQTEQKLVEILTGSDGARETDGTVRCASGEHLITNNQISATVVGSPTTEPELLNYRCGRNSTISGNTIRTGQRAAGILLRDSADENLIENNDVQIGDGNEGALLMQSGSAGYHHPRDNTFRGNVFRADRNRAFWLQASSTRGNTFLQNVFRSDGGTVATVRLTDGPGVTTLFDHNTFYRASAGTLVVFRDLGSGTNTFTNNVFAYPGAATGVFDFDKPLSLAAYRGDHNAFFNSSGPVTFGQYGADLNLWRTTQQDLHSVEADPEFVAPQSGDFTLSAQSALRGIGAAGTDPGAFPVAP